MTELIKPKAVKCKISQIKNNKAFKWHGQQRDIY